MNFKSLLMTAASVTVLASYSLPAAADQIINQWSPDLELEPSNTLEAISEMGNASLTNVSQRIDQADYNEIEANLTSGLYSYDQDIGDDSYQAGENALNAQAGFVGDSVISGSQVFINGFNSVEIDSVAGDSRLEVTQQGWDTSYSSLESVPEIDVDQTVDNDADSSALVGNASVDVRQIGSNTRNTISIASGSTTGYFFTAQPFIEFEQDIDNRAEAVTVVGNAAVGSMQEGFNEANIINTVGATFNAVAIEQWTVDDPVQNVENKLKAESENIGNAEATVDQVGINRANRASLGDVTNQSLVQYTTETDQDGKNTATAAGGDLSGGNASIILNAANASEGYAGGGQVASNTLNKAAFGSAETMYLEQRADDEWGGVEQTAFNYLGAYGGEPDGNASIIAGEGAKGQIAFNSLNTVVGDIGTVGAGEIQQSFEQSTEDQIQSATNRANAFAENGNALIDGLSQSAGGVINSIKLPSDN